MDYLELINQHFGYLVRDFGFEITSRSYHPEALGNFVVTYLRKDFQLRLIRDRSQVFVEFSLDGKSWQDKEKILEGLGVPMSRYKFDKYGLWDGYEIANQGADLQKHFDLIERHLKSKEDNYHKLL